jgi:hypothetical protein
MELTFLRLRSRPSPTPMNASLAALPPRRIAASRTNYPRQAKGPARATVRRMVNHRRDCVPAPDRFLQRATIATKIREFGGASESASSITGEASAKTKTENIGKNTDRIKRGTAHLSSDVTLEVSNCFERRLGKHNASLPRAWRFSNIMPSNNWQCTSRRPCPDCGGRMEYRGTLLTWLTGRYRRVCSRCRYVDPHRTRLMPRARNKTPPQDQ